MRVELSYGRGRLPVELADDLEVTVVRKPADAAAGGPAGRDPARARDARGRAAADRAGATERERLHPDLRHHAAGAERPVPADHDPPAARCGLAPDAITVLVATGLHRPNEGPELEELVGSPWVMETVRVENHFARDDAAHVDLGATPTRGTPVKLDRRFVEADLRIATGLVEPHFMAGYSGGRKVIAPGVAHKDTITTFHSARFMAHPKAENCTLEGNPLHEEQLEIVEMLGGALALNTVIDEERRLSFVNFGEIGRSHMAAVRYVEDYVRCRSQGAFRRC